MLADGLAMIYKLAKCIISFNTVNNNHIGKSYNVVSESYDSSFLKVMKQYNIAMLEKLAIDDKCRILDLACGTGVNIEWIGQNRSFASITGVDISSGMLKKAEERVGRMAKLEQSSMLSYLTRCSKNSFDIITCSWALKYENPHKLLQECQRILSPQGQIGIIVNTSDTLPEIRKIFYSLMARNHDKILRFMRPLPNPRNESHLARMLTSAGFKLIASGMGSQVFSFHDNSEMVEWVTSTGALAGFDSMLELSDTKVRQDMVFLLEKYGLNTITHRFVWGIGKNVS